MPMVVRLFYSMMEYTSSCMQKIVSVSYTHLIVQELSDILVNKAGLTDRR